MREVWDKVWDETFSLQVLESWLVVVRKLKVCVQAAMARTHVWAVSRSVRLMRKSARKDGVRLMRKLARSNSDDRVRLMGIGMARR